MDTLPISTNESGFMQRVLIYIYTYMYIYIIYIYLNMKSSIPVSSLMGWIFQPILASRADGEPQVSFGKFRAPPGAGIPLQKAFEKAFPTLGRAHPSLEE